MSELCIYTNKARLFYKITKKFKDESINFSAIDSFEQINPKFRVLITTKEDLEKYNPTIPSHITMLIINSDQCLDEIVLLTKQKLKFIKDFNDLIIAIDPGSKTSGIAVFLDDVFIYCRDFYNVDHLLNYIQMAFSTFLHHQKIIKLGNGNKEITLNFLDKLYTIQIKENNVQYLLVDEYGSSSYKGNGYSSSLSKHENAAILIGRRKGVLLTSAQLK
ncbi:MAG: hypothetical protein ACTSQ5_09505 [Promethearchaeota archaeon]